VLVVGRRPEGHGARHPRPFRRTAHLPARTSARLSASAFLAGKVIVYSLTAIVQTAVITIVATVGTGAPTYGAAVTQATASSGPASSCSSRWPSPPSSRRWSRWASQYFATYSEQILLTAVADRSDLDGVRRGAVPDIRPVSAGADRRAGAVSMGFAAAAATVDVHAVNPLAEADDSWKQSSGQWLLDMGALIGFGLAATARAALAIEAAVAGRHQLPLISDHNAL